MNPSDSYIPYLIPLAFIVMVAVLATCGSRPYYEHKAACEAAGNLYLKSSNGTNVCVAAKAAP